MTDDQATRSAQAEKRCHEMRSRRPLAVILLTIVFSILCFAARYSPAQTSMELTRWREFSYARQSNQLGSRVTAVTGLQRAGFIMLGDGEFARLWSSTVHTTSPEGKEFYQGFAMYDFNDGSSILAKVDVSGEPQGKQVGTIVFLSGTKRFKGITGRGTISSWMPAQWDMYGEVEASYSVSPQQ